MNNLITKIYFSWLLVSIKIFVVAHTDNVRHYAYICEVISVRLVMAVTSYPIFSRHGDHDEQVK